MLELFSVILSILVLLGYMFCVIWPCRDLTGREPVGTKLFVSLVLVGLFSFLGWEKPFVNGFGRLSAANVFAGYLCTAGSLLYVLTFIAIGQPRRQKKTAIQTDDEPAVKDQAYADEKPRCLSASLFSLPILSVVCLVIAMPFFFDAAILLNSFQDEDCLALARESSQLRRETNGEIGLNMEFSESHVCKFSESTSVDVFSCLAEKELTNLVVFNMRPHIETSMLRNRTKNILMEGGTCTSEQLSNLLNNANGTLVIQNLNVIGESEKGQSW